MGGSDVIGRVAELRLLRRLNDGDALAVVLCGDAGIGKTALWEWAVRQHAAAGCVVLVARAGPAEARLPWVGLTDLLTGVPDAVLAGLPPPQRHALRVVMLQASGGETPDERAVGTAVWRVLAALAAAAPMLVAIDDLPYLDAASAGALRFALRRADPAGRVRVLATARGEPAGGPPLDAFPPERVQSVPVGPMPLDAIFDLLAVRPGIRLARPVLRRVHETSGGNPLYAMELARALQRGEIAVVPGRPLPVPNGLAGLVDAHVRRLPPDVLGIAAGTAAAWRLSAEGLDAAALAGAVEAGLVVVDAAARVVRPVHPLLSAAAYAALSRPDRCALHERLAAGTDDPVEFAAQAALAGTRPAAELAAILDAGVIAAIAGGTPDIAVDLARLAVEHTGDGPARVARLDRLADALFRAGDTQSAIDRQRELIALTPPGPGRARRRVRLAEFLAEVAGWEAAGTELTATLADADGDPAATAEVLITLGQVTADITAMEAYAARAVELLDAMPDPDAMVLASALSHVAGSRFRAGRGLDHESLRRAIAIEAGGPARPLSDRAEAGYAALLKYADDLDGAEARLRPLLAEARASGDLTALAYVLAHLPQIPLWRGRFDEAEAYAREYLMVAEQGMLGSQMVQAQYTVGIVLAHRGRLDEAEALLGLAFGSDSATDWELQRAAGGLGLVQLSRGDPAGAAVHLDRWDEILTGMHFGEPGYSRSHFDYVSALVGADRVEDAERFLARLDGQVARSGRRSAGAVARAGHAMVAAARGRLPVAQAAVAEALAWYAASPFRVDRARTLLVAGRIHRRARTKRLARDALAEAGAELRAMGASVWADQADDELARVNVRPAAPAGLTETERRIAELAAAGLTNRVIAQRMFVSAKTVESNIARVYRKLGIRSRAELGARIG